MATAQFERCYTYSILAAKLQAARVAEELKNGKTAKAEILALEQEAASYEYWRMKGAFSIRGVLEDYEDYEDTRTKLEELQMKKVTINLTREQIKLLAEHFNVDTEWYDLQDWELAELIDQLIDYIDMQRISF